MTTNTRAGSARDWRPRDKTLIYGDGGDVSALYAKISAPLHTRLKSAAAERGVTIRSILEAGLQHELDNPTVQRPNHPANRKDSRLKTA